MKSESQSKTIATPRSNRVAVYVSDRPGQDEPDLDEQSIWVETFGELFTELNGGASKMKIQGVWKNADEETIYVYSFCFGKNHRDIATDCAWMAADYGKRTRQDAVLLEIGPATILLDGGDYDDILNHRYDNILRLIDPAPLN